MQQQLGADVRARSAASRHVHELLADAAAVVNVVVTAGVQTVRTRLSVRTTKSTIIHVPTQHTRSHMFVSIEELRTKFW